jgi:hypothetical protein
MQKSLSRLYNTLEKKIKKGTDFKFIRLRYVFLIALIILVSGLVIVSFYRAFTSDDVVIQTVIRQYFKLPGKGVTWLGEDNYLIKMPFYLLLDVFFKNSRHLIIGTSVILNVIGFGFFFYSYVYFLRLFKLFETIPRLAIIWLCSLTVTLSILFLLNPNLRNLEIGISFLTLTIISKYMHGSISFSGVMGKMLATLLMLAFAIFLYSDPFFVVMLLVPVIIFCLVLLYQRKQTKVALMIIGFLILSYMIMTILRVAIPHLYINSRSPETQFIPFDKLGWTINQTLQSLLVIFQAEFWSKNILSTATVQAIANLTILLTILSTPIVLLKRKHFNKHDPWIIFWLLQPIYILLVYILSNNTVLNGNPSMRFLVLLPFYTPIIFAIAYQKIFKQNKSKALITAILVIAITLNCIAFLRLAINRPKVSPNVDNYNAIAYLENIGVTKGVAHYWNSQITTYLSNDVVTVIPVNCLQIQHLLMNDKALNIPADKTFYLYDEGHSPNCTIADITKVLGSPIQSVNLSPSKKIYIYNYDITTRFTSGYFVNQ